MLAAVAFLKCLLLLSNDDIYSAYDDHIWLYITCFFTYSQQERAAESEKCIQSPFVCLLLVFQTETGNQLTAAVITAAYSSCENLISLQIALSVSHGSVVKVTR